MKIAVATSNNQISEHFGHCEEFTIFECENQSIISSEKIENPGHKPGFLPNFLADQEISVIITGGIGKNAILNFEERGIKVITGATGSMEDAVKIYLEGKLESSGSICNKHEHRGECNNH